MKIVLLVCCMILFGCGHVTSRIEQPADVKQKPQVFFIYPDPREENLQWACEIAANRWWNVVGVDVQVSEAGLPIQIVPDEELISKFVTPEGKIEKIQNRAAVSFNEDGLPYRIRIARFRYFMGRQELIDTLMHEFGHMFGVRNHTTGIINGPTSLGAEVTPDDIFEVCKKIRCLWKRPE